MITRLRIGFGAGLLALTAACTPLDPEREAYDAATSALFATLPLESTAAYIRLADGLARTCRRVERRAGVPSADAIATAVAAERAAGTQGETLSVSRTDARIERNFRRKHRTQRGIEGRTCDIALIEIQQETPIGRLLMEAE